MNEPSVPPEIDAADQPAETISVEPMPLAVDPAGNAETISVEPIPLAVDPAGDAETISVEPTPRAVDPEEAEREAARKRRAKQNRLAFFWLMAFTFMMFLAIAAGGMILVGKVLSHVSNSESIK